jgi:tetratricopeptide (TPR) repeat protein
MLKKKTPPPKSSPVRAAREKPAPVPSRGGRVAASSEGSVGIAQRDGSPQQQLKLFEQAIRAFRAGKFGPARELFGDVIKGPSKEMAHNAELHVRMCDRRLEKPPMEFRTRDDHYDYAVERINARDLAPAIQHLETALRLDPKADHVYYALGLCCGLTGDLVGAYENLKRAIDLQPRNRLVARQDPDFASFAHQAPISDLLFR